MEKYSLVDGLLKALDQPHPVYPDRKMPAYKVCYELNLSPSVVNKMIAGSIKTIRISSAMLLFEKYGIEIDPAYISGNDRTITSKENN